MWNELNTLSKIKGVTIMIFCSSEYLLQENPWRCTITHSEGGIKVETKSDDSDTIGDAVESALTKYHAAADNVREFTKAPQIEHQRPIPITNQIAGGIEPPNQSANWTPTDDDIPF